MVAAADLRGLTDAEAIERSLSDPEAFGVVFERHVALLHRFARVRVGDGEAADLVAGTFEIAFRRRGDYDLTRSNARPWLIGIAVNLIRHNRRDRGRALRTLARLFVYDEVEDRSLERAVASDGVAALRDLLSCMREEDKDLLLLHACLDLTYEECAEVLRLPVGTVRSRLHRLRAPLRTRLEAIERETKGARDVRSLR
ncbi:MAG: sigma-70 family RNA polymerase sigma factor [Actinobacteria bacterium]|nr:sigma-70 family RNA polymerase sigma factor [Actinomycetota bacterium]